MQNQHKTVPLNDGRPPWATNGTRKKKNHEEMKKKIVEIMDGREKQKIEQMTKNKQNKIKRKRMMKEVRWRLKETKWIRFFA